MRAWTAASFRLRPARFVKYEMVIGTIGNTHGVSSDSAPMSAASPMYAPIVPARDDAAMSVTRLRDGVAVFPAGAAFNPGAVEPLDGAEAVEPAEPDEPAE